MYASVSRLDSFNLLRTTDWMTAERFVEQVKSPFVENRAMQLGKDVHSFAEHRPITQDDVESKYRFEWDAHNVVEIINATPPDSAREVPSSIVLPTSRGDLFVPGRADSLRGLTCTDHKTTEKSFMIDSYPDAFQWRLYLLMFGCKRFVYDLIKIKRDRQTDLFYLERETPVTMYAYADMEQDCLRLVEDFVLTMERLGLSYTLESKKRR